MQGTKEITFGQFRLDLASECLWRGDQIISLRPKAYAVLKLLLEHPRQLVSKRQVLDTVWPSTFVGDAVLKDNIRQIREALGDDADAPTYIETAHRRGYRFIGAISLAVPNQPATRGPGVGPRFVLETNGISSATSGLFGRSAELATLHKLLERTLDRNRQVVFVTGEPGIGKTTLVQAFLEKAAGLPGVAIARGQCIEQYGAGEAYFPVLDGFSRLCRSAEGARIVSILRQEAPTWLAQMPSQFSQSESVGVPAQVAGATRERMLREMANAVEALAVESPLLLVLEDLHWSDYSTLDLLSYLARRRDAAQLMIIGTYRPVDLILSEHPLKSVKRELQAHSLCYEIPLEYLSEEAVGQYLDVRFPEHRLPSQLRRTIYLRTEGNPLFMVNMVEFLCEQGMIAEEDGRWFLHVRITEVEKGVPASIRQLIEKKMERLNADERSVLEAASVAGMECSSAAMAAGLEMPAEWVEKHCEELARRHQLLSPGWLVQLPDGTMTPRYRFNHILYQEVPYGLISPMRRAQLHHRIAVRGAAIFGDRAGEIAAELAMHFEQSRDWSRAVQYVIQAAENAMRRSAHREAAGLAERGLEVVKRLTDSPGKAQQEIKLRMTLGMSLMSLKGFAATEVEEVYAPARELFRLQGPSPELFQMLWSSSLFYQFRAQMDLSLEISTQMLHLAEGLEDGALIMEAHRNLGSVLFLLGRPAEAVTHLDKAIALYETHGNHAYSVFLGVDCKAICECFQGLALWALGYPVQAAERMERGLAVARDLGHPQTLAVCLHSAVHLHQMTGEVAVAHQRAKEAMDLADEYGLELWYVFGVVELGWAEAKSGDAEQGIEQMKRGLAAYEATGSRLRLPHFLALMADGFGEDGRFDEGLEVIAKALTIAQDSGEGCLLAELYRVKGEFLLKRERAGNRPKQAVKVATGGSETTKEAQACFGEALKIARQQCAKSWELKVHMSLFRLQLELGKPMYEGLSKNLSEFTEGWDTEDLKQAKHMLELGST